MTGLKRLVGSNLAMVYRPTEWLKPDPDNARMHPRKQINKLCRALRNHGFNQPILCDQDGIIIAGHARHEAATLIGLKTVPCVILHNLTPTVRKALALSDNRLGDESHFDDAMLRKVLKDLDDADYDLELTGFEMGEIDFRLDGAAGPVKADSADAPLIVGYGVKPVTRIGDLWLLGPHRLLCGSALEAASFDRLLEGEKARLVFVDCPFNVRISGHVSGLGKHRHREFASASGEMTDKRFRDFLRDAHNRLAEHSMDGSITYSCMDWRGIGNLLAACEGVYAELKNIIVWGKNSGGMGSFYRSQHELIAVFKKGKTPHVNNVALGKHGRFRTNLWDYPGANSFGPTRDADLAAHPTCKPVALVADAIKDCSKRGELVLDSFLGSGTTLLAAERTGRRGAGIEIDPLYVDVAVRRWQQLTGGKATLDGDGRTFDQIAAERTPVDALSEEAGR